MRLGVIAYAVLAVVHAKNESNATCCCNSTLEHTPSEHHSSGLQVQHQSQYVNQNRPFQQYRPVVTSTSVPPQSNDIKDVASLNVSRVSVSGSAVLSGMVAGQYRTQYIGLSRYPLQPYKPIIPLSVGPQHTVETAYKTSLNLSKAPLTSTSASDPVQSVPLITDQTVNDTDSHTQTVQSGEEYTQFNTEKHTEQTGHPYQSYKPNIPTTISSQSQGQYSSQYTEPIRQPFQPYKPVIPLTEDSPPSSVQHFPQTQYDHDQYQNQYTKPNRFPYKPYKPDIPYSISGISQSSQSQSQYSSQYTEPIRQPFQPYKPVIPLTEDSSPSSVQHFPQTQYDQDRYQTQYTEPNRLPYEPYKPDIPFSYQHGFEQESTTSFAPPTSSNTYGPPPPPPYITSLPSYGGQTVNQHHAQYMEENRYPHQPYKPFIPAPFEPVSPDVTNSASTTDKSTSVSVPLQGPPAISINIVSNGRTLFDDYIRRNNTLPLIKILINNVFNYNSL